MVSRRKLCWGSQYCVISSKEQELLGGAGGKRQSAGFVHKGKELLSRAAAVLRCVQKGAEILGVGCRTALCPQGGSTAWKVKGCSIGCVHKRASNGRGWEAAVLGCVHEGQQCTASEGLQHGLC